MVCVAGAIAQWFWGDFRDAPIVFKILGAMLLISIDYCIHVSIAPMIKLSGYEKIPRHFITSPFGVGICGLPNSPRSRAFYRPEFLLATLPRKVYYLR